MGKVIQLWLGLILASSAYAQSASNFDTKPLAPAVPTQKGASGAKPASPEAAPVTTTPSRNIAPDDMDAYLVSMSAVFMSRERATDPFGHLQDPDARPVIKTPLAQANRPAAIQAVPFEEIIRLIKINAIMPGEKRFLIGTRTIRKGDQIPLIHRNRQIRAQVIDVTSKQIDFRNLDTGETASRVLDILPAGMTPGSNGITAPGMTLDQPNAPIELETGDPAAP